jgi:hypothetical protein
MNYAEVGRAAMATAMAYDDARQKRDLLNYYRERAMGDQREDLHAIKHRPLTSRYEFEAQSTAVKLSPSQIIRDAISRAERDNNYIAMGDLALKLAQLGD